MGNIGGVRYKLPRGGGKPGIKGRLLGGTRWQSDFSILRMQKQRWPEVRAYLRDVGDAVAVVLAKNEVWGGLENGIVGSVKRHNGFVARARGSASMSLSPPLVICRYAAGRSLTYL